MIGPTTTPARRAQADMLRDAALRVGLSWLDAWRVFRAYQLMARATGWALTEDYLEKVLRRRAMDLDWEPGWEWRSHQALMAALAVPDPED